MKKILMLLAFVLALSAEVLAGEEEVGVDAAKIIKATQDALAAANAALDEEDLKLSKVTLKLNTAVDSGKSGKIKVLFFEFGGEGSSSISNTLTVELGPPKDETAPEDVSEKDIEDVEKLAKALIDTIVNLAVSMGAAKTEGVPLVVNKITGDLKFVVKKSGEAGVEFELSPVTLELGAKASSAREQQLTVEVTRAI